MPDRIEQCLPPEMLEHLRHAYATPPRAYHNYGHVQEVLAHHAHVAAGPGWARPCETALAILYHDAIYQAGRSDNEARSAQLAREQIARWLPDRDIDVERVAALILLTRGHGGYVPDDFSADREGDDTRHFLDCDMAILGAEPALFDAYDRGIAAEFQGVVPAWIFHRKRRAFLKGLLQRPRIYLSDFFHQRLEAQARSNLQRMIGR